MKGSASCSDGVGGLRKLLEIVSRLQERGTIPSEGDDDDIFVVRELLHSPPVYNDPVVCEAKLKSFFDAVQGLKPLEHTLQSLLCYVQDVMANLRASYIPLAHHIGIQSLPPELLSRIFENAYSPDDVVENTDRFSLHVSHVNRRFRTVALDTPRIWSTISNCYSRNEIQAYLERSKATKLRISISEDLTLKWDHPPISPLSISDFLDLILPYATRWEELGACIADDVGFKAFTSIESLELPALTTLLVEHCLDNSHSHMFSTTFASTWTLPSLRTFLSSSMVPHPNWASRLTTIRVTLGANEVFSLNSLLRSLQGCRQLESLFIDAVDDTGAFTADDDVVANMPHLALLSIKVDYLREPSLMSLLLYKLDAPNLTELSLEIGLRRDANEIDWPFNIHPLRPARLAPEFLDFVITRNDAFTCDVLLTYFLSRLPHERLTRLHMEAPQLLFSIPTQDFVPQKLKRVSFENCPSLSGFDLLTFANELSHDAERLEFLQELAVIESDSRPSANKWGPAGEILTAIQSLLDDKFVYERTGDKE